MCVCVGVCYCCKVQEHKLLLFHLSGLEASADLAVLSVAVAAVGYKDQVQESLDSSLIGHAVTQTFCIKISCLIW